MTSGTAIDCCGRELILERDTPSSFRRARATLTARTACGNGEDQGGEPLLVLLRYVEHAVEKVPVLFHEGACDPARNEANRIRRGRSYASGRCTTSVPAAGASPAAARPGVRHDGTDACADGPGPGVPCLHPDCPCGEAVPLALITGAGESGSEFEIDTGGRRELPPAGQQLTHVAAINWPHGGSLTLDELVGRDRRLEVRFDRRLAPAQGDATGINEYTFQVEWGNPLEGEREHLRYDPDYPPTVEDGCRAIFTIHPDYLEVCGGATRSRAAQSS